MNKLILVLALLATGCATNKIVDRDFEKEEKAFIKQHGEKAKDPMFSPATPDLIKAGEEDRVRITLYKGTSTVTQDHLELQNWYAIVKNYGSESKCVGVHWKLMDFEMITDYPDFTLLKPGQEIKNYATFKQQLWNLDGTRFALPPSGYIEKMIVVDPDNKKGCVFNSDTVIEK